MIITKIFNGRKVVNTMGGLIILLIIGALIYGTIQEIYSTSQDKKNGITRIYTQYDRDKLRKKEYEIKQRFGNPKWGDPNYGAYERARKAEIGTKVYAPRTWHHPKSNVVVSDEEFMPELPTNVMFVDRNSKELRWYILDRGQGWDTPDYRINKNIEPFGYIECTATFDNINSIKHEMGLWPNIRRISKIKRVKKDTAEFDKLKDTLIDAVKNKKYNFYGIEYETQFELIKIINSPCMSYTVITDKEIIPDKPADIIFINKPLREMTWYELAPCGKYVEYIVSFDIFRDINKPRADFWSHLKGNANKKKYEVGTVEFEKLRKSLVESVKNKNYSYLGKSYNTMNRVISEIIL